MSLRPVFKKVGTKYMLTGEGLTSGGKLVTSYRGVNLPNSNKLATKKEFLQANGVVVRTKKNQLLKNSKSMNRYSKPKGTSSVPVKKDPMSSQLAQLQKNNGLLAGHSLITSGDSYIEIPISLTITNPSGAAKAAVFILGDALNFIRTQLEDKGTATVDGTHGANTVEYFQNKAKFQKCYFSYLQISAYAADGTTPKPEFFNGRNVAHSMSDDLANVVSFPLSLFKGLNSQAQSPQLREFKDHAFAFLAQNAMKLTIPVDTRIEFNMILRENSNAFIGQNVMGSLSC